MNNLENFTDQNNVDPKSWERDVIKELLSVGIKEQRSLRRWNIFFKLLGFGYVIIVTLSVYFNEWKKTSHEAKKEHSAVIEVIGEISKDSAANADNINRALKNACTNKQVKGVILKINSPGGSPVQARQIYNNIIKLQTENPNIKIYAAIEDLGTSAAYLIASAADKIYADETSLVGSIGVVINSFGFVDTLKKLGIERRIYTAGKNKAMLDPFSPSNPEHEEFINQQLTLTHKLFIKNVLDKRPQLASRSENEELFSGKFWIGQAALELGLIDGFGDVQHIAEKVIKVPEIRDYTFQPSLLQRIGSRLKVMIKDIILS